MQNNIEDINNTTETKNENKDSPNKCNNNFPRKKASIRFPRFSRLPKIKKAVNIFQRSEIDDELDGIASQIEITVPHQKIFRIDDLQLLKLVLHALSKNTRSHNEIKIIHYYLSIFPKIVDILNIRKLPIDPNEIINKLAHSMKKDEFRKGEIVCINGEIGDKLYLIFKGKVAVLVPMFFEYSMTELEYYNHLLTLKRYKEYNILLKTIADNRHYSVFPREITYLENDLYNYYDMNTKDIISVNQYIKRIKPKRNISQIDDENIPLFLDINAITFPNGNPYLFERYRINILDMVQKKNEMDRAEELKKEEEEKNKEQNIYKQLEIEMMEQKKLKEKQEKGISTKNILVHVKGESEVSNNSVAPPVPKYVKEVSLQLSLKNTNDFYKKNKNQNNEIEKKNDNDKEENENEVYNDNDNDNNNNDDKGTVHSHSFHIISSDEENEDEKIINMDNDDSNRTGTNQTKSTAKKIIQEDIKKSKRDNYPQSNSKKKDIYFNEPNSNSNTTLSKKIQNSTLNNYDMKKLSNKNLTKITNNNVNNNNKKKQAENSKDNSKNINKNIDKENYLTKQYKFTIWSYSQVCELGPGTRFGELALSGGTAKDVGHRTATIICLENCEMGSLTKKVYSNCMSEIESKNRSIHVDYIICNKLFDDFSKQYFTSQYFNYFTYVRIGKGQYLFKQGMQPNKIYFLYKGEVEITMTSSFNNINKISNYLVQQINKKDRKFKNEYNNDTNNYVDKLNQLYEKIKNYYDRVRDFRLYYINNSEIIGLEDFTINGVYFANAICYSDKCDIYSIDKKLFVDMVKKEYTLRNNYVNVILEKYKLMVSRLDDYKNKNIIKYYDSTIKYDMQSKERENAKIKYSSIDNKIINLNEVSTKKRIFNLSLINYSNNTNNNDSYLRCFTSMNKMKNHTNNNINITNYNNRTIGSYSLKKNSTSKKKMHSHQNSSLKSIGRNVETSVLNTNSLNFETNSMIQQKSLDNTSNRINNSFYPKTGNYNYNKQKINCNVIRNKIYINNNNALNTNTTDIQETSKDSKNMNLFLLTDSTRKDRGNKTNNSNNIYDFIGEDTSKNMKIIDDYNKIPSNNNNNTDESYVKGIDYFRDAKKIFFYAKKPPIPTDYIERNIILNNVVSHIIDQKSNVSNLENSYNMSKSSNNKCNKETNNSNNKTILNQSLKNTVNDVNFLAMDDFIKKIENKLFANVDCKFRVSDNTQKIFKGSVYKLKKKKVLLNTPNEFYISKKKKN